MNKTEDGIYVERSLGGIARDDEDDKEFRHGMNVNVGFPVGQYLQPQPLLNSRHNHNLYLGDLYRGGALFMICGGPSLKDHDLSKLDNPGFMTMGINNSPAAYRPNLWVSVDNPHNFIQSIWLDPKIMKFVPVCHREKTIFNSDKMQHTDIKVGDCPSMMFYHRNEKFQPKQFLYEDSVNWGNHTNFCDCGHERGDKAVKVCPHCKRDNWWGSRTVMLAATRLAFFLGFRRIYLLGADFKMEEGKDNYAFKQNRSANSVKNNNNTYRMLNKRFDDLKPSFKTHNFEIYNCYEDSGLRSFPFVDYEEAVNRESLIVAGQNTEGLYDREKNDKELKKQIKEDERKQRNGTLDQFLYNKIKG